MKKMKNTHAHAHTCRKTRTHLVEDTHMQMHMHTHLVEAVVDGQLVIVEQDLLLGGEEPLAQRQAGPGHR